MLNYCDTSIFFFILLELIAVITGIISIIFSFKTRILTYPIGLISTSIYIYLSFIVQLYGDMILNIIYTFIGFYGWYIWNNKKNKIKITHSNKKDYLISTLLSLLLMIILIIIYYINGSIKQYYIWIDIFTTCIFFIGMYQMSLKKVENWIFWTIANIISIPLYIYKGMIITSIQFLIFTILSTTGYFIWKNEIKKEKI